MRLRTMGACLCFALFALAGFIHGEEAGPPLPPQLKVHISIQSAKALLDAADSIASKATSGTRNSIPPGLMTMLAQMYCPFPAGSWRNDTELHVLFPESTPGLSEGVVLFSSTSGLDDFIAALANTDIKLLKLDTDETEKPVYMLDLPSGNTIILMEIDDTVLALSNRLDPIKAAVAPILDGSWQPRHRGDALLTAEIATASDTNPMRTVIDELAKSQRELMTELATYKINPAVTLGAIAAMGKYLPAFGAGMQKMKGLRLDFWLHPDALHFTLGVRSDASSVFAAAAAAAATRDNVDISLADMVSTDAASVTIFAPPAEIVPGIATEVSQTLAGIAQLMFPAQKEAIEASLAELAPAFSIGGVTAQYAVDDMFRATGYAKPDDPAALLMAIKNTVPAVNAMLATLVPDIPYQMRLEVGSGTTGSGVEYGLIKPAFNSEASMGDFFNSIRNRNPGFTLTPWQLKAKVIFMAVKDGYFVSQSGVADAESFDTALKALDGGGAPMLATPSAKAIVGRIENRQAGLMVLDADQAVFDLARRFTEGMGEMHGPEGMAVTRRGFNKAKTAYKKTGDCIGAGFGARDGLPQVEAVVPISFIKALVQFNELFGDALQADAPTYQ